MSEYKTHTERERERERYQESAELDIGSKPFKNVIDIDKQTYIAVVIAELDTEKLSKEQREKRHIQREGRRRDRQKGWVKFNC